MKNALIVILLMILTIWGTVTLTKHVPKRFSQEHLQSLGLIKNK